MASCGARRLLGSAITGEHGFYRLDRSATDVDLDELERLLATAKSTEAEHAQALTESALRLFRGEPLAGADYAWAESELARLRASFVGHLEQAQALTERALRLFHGEPLAGADYAWSESELTRLRATFVGLLEQLARYRLERGDPQVALDAAERGLQVDTLNESLWRLAMEAEHALGLREAVAERYERLRDLLGERLGLEPARETRHLHRRLLGQT